MYGNFESIQGLEVGDEDFGNEVYFTIGLVCTARSIPGDRTDPPCGPEFAPTYVTLLTADEVPLVDMDWTQFVLFIGDDVAIDILARAGVDAIENGDF